MIVQQMRLQKGWSQQQLADISGLNVRTIQRIEQGQSASLESFKALGAAFNVDFSQLQEDAVREIVSSPEQTEITLAFSHVREVKRFWNGVLRFVVIMSFLTAFNLYYQHRILWVIPTGLFWAMLLGMRAITTFELLPWFGAEWERRLVEKRLGRKL